MDYKVKFIPHKHAVDRLAEKILTVRILVAQQLLCIYKLSFLKES